MDHLSIQDPSPFLPMSASPLNSVFRRIIAKRRPITPPDPVVNPFPTPSVSHASFLVDSPPPLDPVPIPPESGPTSHPANTKPALPAILLKVASREVVSFQGTSQPVHGPNRAVTSLNAIRCVLLLEQTGVRGIQLIHAILQEALVKDVTCISPAWSMDDDFDMDDIYALPLFSRSLNFVGSKNTTADLDGMLSHLKRLRSHNSGALPGLLLARRPQVVAVMNISTYFPDFPELFLTFDPLSRSTLHPHGSAFIFFPSLLTTAKYLETLFQQADDIPDAQPEKEARDWWVDPVQDCRGDLFEAQDFMANDITPSTLEANMALLEVNLRFQAFKKRHDAVVRDNFRMAEELERLQMQVDENDDALDRLNTQLADDLERMGPIPVETGKSELPPLPDLDPAARQVILKGVARSDSPQTQQGSLRGLDAAEPEIITLPNPVPTLDSDEDSVQGDQPQDPAVVDPDEDKAKEDNPKGSPAKNFIPESPASDVLLSHEDVVFVSPLGKGKELATDEEQEQILVPQQWKGKRIERLEADLLSSQWKGKGVAKPGEVIEGDSDHSDERYFIVGQWPTEKSVPSSSNTLKPLPAAPAPPLLPTRNKKAKPIRPIPTSKTKEREKEKVNISQMDADAKLALDLQRQLELEANAPPPKRADEPTFECGICKDKHHYDSLAVVDACSHEFCRTCLYGYIVSRLDEGSYPMLCPTCFADRRNPNPANLTRYDIEIIGLTERQFQRWAELEMVGLCVVLNCPSCRYSTWLDAEDYRANNVLRCPQCDYYFCKLCRAATTRGVAHTCSIPTGDAQLNALVQERGWKYCPGCQIAVEQEAGGCNHMLCLAPGCNTHFCYVCGEQIVRSIIPAEIEEAVRTHYRNCQLFDVPL